MEKNKKMKLKRIEKCVLLIKEIKTKVKKVDKYTFLIKK